MEHSQADAPGRPLLIGWKEYVELPDWGLRHVKVKVDTGARTSVADVASYELQEHPGQVTVALLRLALNRRHPERLTVVETPVLDMITVTSSLGVSEERPLFETRLRLGPVVKTIRLTVTNRSGMTFRMLLGRHALAGDFVVDVSKKYLLKRK
jgi:hypothetical protein